MVQKEIEKVKAGIKEIENPETLEELKDQLKLKKAGLEILNNYSITESCESLKKQIERTEKNIRDLEYKICHKSILDAIYSEPIKNDVSEWERLFGVAALFMVAKKNASLPEKTFHIVTDKGDPIPRKIQINERTEKTIQFIDWSNGKTTDRMFISDFLANYTIHESFD